MKSFNTNYNKTFFQSGFQAIEKEGYQSMRFEAIDQVDNRIKII